MDAGVIYSQGFSFMMVSPMGWVMDNKASLSQGLNAVFYPKGGSWKHSDIVMYVHTVPRAREMSLEQFADYAAKNHIRKTYSSRYFREAPLHIAGSQYAQIRTFTKDRWGKYDIAGYIGEDDVFVVIVMNANNRTLLEKHIPDFEELIKSYTFLANTQ